MKKFTKETVEGERIDEVEEKEETLVTIANCAVSKEHKALPCSLFDKAFTDMGYEIQNAFEFQINRES